MYSIFVKYNLVSNKLYMYYFSKACLGLAVVVYGDGYGGGGGGGDFGDLYLQLMISRTPTPLQ